MTKEFDDAIEAGWREVCREDTVEIYENHHTISFVRPKQRPNAIVDWEKLEQLLRSSTRYVETKLLEDVWRCIKKA